MQYYRISVEESPTIISREDDGQPGSYQLARWVITDKRACGK